MISNQSISLAIFPGLGLRWDVLPPHGVCYAVEEEAWTPHTVTQLSTMEPQIPGT